MDSEPAFEMYAVTDPGQEGLFVVDASDTTSQDNTGTIVVSTHGTRFIRQFTGPVSVRWFGAKGDGSVDDAPAIQSAVDYAQVTGEPVRNGGALGLSVYFPAGLYTIAEPIILDPTKRPLRVFGDGRHSCIQGMDGDDVIDAIFWFDTTRNRIANGWRFHDLYLVAGIRPSGGTNVTYGIRGHLTRSVFRDLVIQSFSREDGAGIYFGYGWSNTIETCSILHCRSAIRSLDNNLNSVNIVNCLLRQSRGPAIYFPQSMGGLLVHIRGCTIEGNWGPAILVEGSLRGLDVSDCYFEVNCTEPHQLKDRDESVHADIVIGTHLQEAGPIRISNNLVNQNIGLPNDNGYFVVCHSASGGLEIVDTRVENPPAPRTRRLVRLGPSATPSYLVRNVSIRSTSVQRPDADFEVLEIDQLEGLVNSFHETSIEGVEQVNYCPPPSEFSVVHTQGGGTLSGSAQRYRMFPTWEITADAGPSDIFGFVLDVDEHPELAGKYVYLACYAKPSDTDTGAVLWTSQLGAQVEDPPGDTQWRVLSYVDKLPTSGTVEFGIGAISGGSSSNLQIAKPVLAEVGARFDKFDNVSLALMSGLGRAAFLRSL